MIEIQRSSYCCRSGCARSFLRSSSHSIITSSIDIVQTSFRQIDHFAGQLERIWSKTDLNEALHLRERRSESVSEAKKAVRPRSSEEKSSSMSLVKSRSDQKDFLRLALVNSNLIQYVLI